MFGLLLALTIFALKLFVGTVLLEEALVDGFRFLFWWYVVMGVVTISLAALAWAGDLGTEGARLRHGIATALGWMLGLPRVPLQYKSALVFLILRRLLLGVGVYWLTRGLRAVGATFVWDERLLWAGGLALGVGLLMGVLVPLLRRVSSSAHEGVSV